MGLIMSWSAPAPAVWCGSNQAQFLCCGPGGLRAAHLSAVGPAVLARPRRGLHAYGQAHRGTELHQHMSLHSGNTPLHVSAPADTFTAAAAGCVQDRGELLSHPEGAGQAAV